MMNISIALWLTLHYEHFPTTLCDDHFPMSHCNERFPSSQCDDHFPFVINVLRKNINHCLKSKTWFHASHCIMMNIFIALWLTLHYDEHFPMSHYDKHFPTSHSDEHFPMSHFDACFPSSQSDENFHFVVNVLRKNINHCLKSKTWFHTSHCD
jgi:hypothetical protein